MAIILNRFDLGASNRGSLKEDESRELSLVLSLIDKEDERARQEIKDFQESYTRNKDLAISLGLLKYYMPYNDEGYNNRVDRLENTINQFSSYTPMLLRSMSEALMSEYYKMYNAIMAETASLGKAVLTFDKALSDFEQHMNLDDAIQIGTPSLSDALDGSIFNKRYTLSGLKVADAYKTVVNAAYKLGQADLETIFANNSVRNVKGEATMIVNTLRLSVSQLKREGYSELEALQIIAQNTDNDALKQLSGRVFDEVQVGVGKLNAYYEPLLKSASDQEYNMFDTYRFLGMSAGIEPPQSSFTQDPNGWTNPAIAQINVDGSKVRYNSGSQITTTTVSNNAGNTAANNAGNTGSSGSNGSNGNSRHGSRNSNSGQESHKDKHSGRRHHHSRGDGRKKKQEEPNNLKPEDTKNQAPTLSIDQSGNNTAANAAASNNTSATSNTVKTTTVSANGKTSETSVKAPTLSGGNILQEGKKTYVTYKDEKGLIVKHEIIVQGTKEAVENGKNGAFKLKLGTNYFVIYDKNMNIIGIQEPDAPGSKSLQLRSASTMNNTELHHATQAKKVLLLLTYGNTHTVNTRATGSSNSGTGGYNSGVNRGAVGNKLANKDVNTGKR